MSAIMIKMDISDDIQKCRDLESDVERSECLQGIKDKIVRVKDLVSKFAQDEGQADKSTPCPMMQNMMGKDHQQMMQNMGDHESSEGNDSDEVEGEGELDPETEQKIRDFVASQDNLDDSDFHSYVQSLGVDPHEAEEVIYKQVRDQSQNESLQEQYFHPRAFYAMAIKLHQKHKNWDKVREELTKQYHAQGSRKKTRFIGHVIGVAQKLVSGSKKRTKPISSTKK